jgi:hypothetical protein
MNPTHLLFPGDEQGSQRAAKIMLMGLLTFVNAKEKKNN